MIPVVTRRRRRDEPTPDPQERLLWTEAERVLSEAPAGEVVYEAPEIRRRAPRGSKAGPVQSLGLPFGVREADGHKVCWSCGHDLDDASIVRAGPGDTRCGGCGAKLPFNE